MMEPATSPDLPHVAAQERRWRWLLSSIWRGVWFVLAPALLAVGYLRYALPSGTRSGGGVIDGLIRFGHEQLVPIGAGLFLVFALLLRYWQPYLPGAKLLVAGNAVAPGLDVPATKKVQWGHILQTLLAAALAAAAAVLLRGHVLAPVRVLSGSMLPGLAPGDLVLIDRTAYGAAAKRGAGEVPVRRGDIVVLTSPEAGAPAEQLIKRVIGLPGDRIAMHASRPVINGWEVPSCEAGHYLYVLPGGAVSARLLVEFLEDRIYLTIAAPPPRDFREPYEVQPGEVFVLGDNRNNSADSRAWNEGRGGGVPLDRIEGGVRRFLFGTRRDRNIDTSRLLQLIDSLRLHLEGVDVTGLQEGIAKCLAAPPENTRVPAVSADAPNAPAVPAPIPFRGE